MRSQEACQCGLPNWSRLGRPCLASQLVNCLDATAGWSSTIPVCAYVVSIRNAAAPDKDGLLQVGWAGRRVVPLPLPSRSWCSGAIECLP